MEVFDVCEVAFNKDLLPRNLIRGTRLPLCWEVDGYVCDKSGG